MGFSVAAPKATRRLRLALATLAGLWVIYAALMATGVTVSISLPGRPLTDFMYCALLLGAGVLCLVRAAGQRAERWIWVTVGVGLVLWSFGDIWWVVFYAEASDVPYPSLADGFWLASYPPMAYGLWRLISLRVGWRALGAAAWLDGAIAALAGSAIFAATLLAGPLAAAAQGQPMTFATNLAYPIGDLILLGFALAALSATGWHPGRAIGLIAAGLLLRALADFVYLDQVTRGSYAGGILDATWPAASLLVAAAACVPTGRSRREADWRVILAPALFVTTSVGLLVFDHFNRLPASAIILAGFAVGVAALRMVTMVRVTVASTRHEAATDPLTGLPNRRTLKRDLDRALEGIGAGQEFLFAMFDLNGFKGYNDTFGHPAGDSLLTRLGGRLSDAAAPGHAYRLGGDEFCVLVPDRGDCEAQLARADTALSASGDGFTISAARGSVRIPSEVVDPEEIMHLADRRMYAVKLGRRADGDHTVDVLSRAVHEAHPAIETGRDQVAELTRDVGHKLGLTPEEIDEVMRAAKLQDVGMMAIPDAILGKPGPLNEGEWEYIRKHPVIGERIVAAAPPLLPVARLVRSSHERWDGGGYPDGLAGESVSLGARILFACDSFDAMTSPRPYRQGRTHEDALAEMRRCAGTQFDPAVVEALTAVMTKRPAAVA
jgi:two-component system cell cycle response regulator